METKVHTAQFSLSSQHSQELWRSPLALGEAEEELFAWMSLALQNGDSVALQALVDVKLLGHPSTVLHILKLARLVEARRVVI